MNSDRRLPFRGCLFLWKVTDLERTHCTADARHIRHFLDCCEGNWHQCVYVRCVSCKTPGYCRQPDFLYHPDPEGKPCVLLMRDARLLFARLPEPTECAGALTMEQFTSLYRPYLEKEGLLEAPCLPEALLRLQEAACYDW